MRAHPMRLGAHREGETLHLPHVSSSVFSRTRSPALARQTSRYSRSNRVGIARLDRQRCQRDQRARHAESCRSLRQRIAVLVVRATDQRTSSGATPARTSERGGLAPALPVGLVDQRDPLHRAEQTLSRPAFQARRDTVCSRHDARPGSLRRDRRRRAHRPSRVTAKTLFHLRGSGLPQVWALDLATGADRQLTLPRREGRAAAPFAGGRPADLRHRPRRRRAPATAAARSA